MYFDVEKNRPMKSRVFLVCGSPASGKSTYVNRHLEKGDFIFDMDLLRRAFGAPYKTSGFFQSQCLAVRELIYNQIQMNRIGAKTIWVISALPDRAQREATAKRLGATIIFIDTDRQTCIQQAMGDETRIDKAVQLKIIDEYFKKLT